MLGHLEPSAQQEWILQLNGFLVIHLISEALRLTFGTQCSTAFHNGHQASTGYDCASQHPTAAGQTSASYDISRETAGCTGPTYTANLQYEI